jgi:hypothetical protein
MLDRNFIHLFVTVLGGLLPLSFFFSYCLWFPRLFLFRYYPLRSSHGNTPSFNSARLVNSLGDGVFFTLAEYFLVMWCGGYN